MTILDLALSIALGLFIIYCFFAYLIAIGVWYGFDIDRIKKGTPNPLTFWPFVLAPIVIPIFIGVTIGESEEENAN